MKLANQVSSLELSKKLKELGVKQESLFYYHYLRGLNEVIVYDVSAWSLRPKKTKGYRLTSAFTVAELGEIIFENDYHIPVYDGDEKYWWFYPSRDENYSVNTVRLKDIITEADARTKMLIYLIENKLIQI